jgi:hypothetical protein
VAGSSQPPTGASDERPELSSDVLTAFVEGTLDSTERAAVLEVLARSRPDRELLADVVALLAEGERPRPH